MGSPGKVPFRVDLVGFNFPMIHDCVRKGQRVRFIVEWYFRYLAVMCLQEFIDLVTEYSV